MMRLIRLTFAGAGLLLAPLAISAQELPHLDFLRGLRNQGMADLASEYLTKLRTTELPNDLRAALNLEEARTLLDLAANETDDAKKNAQLAQARVKYDDFLKASPNHTLAPQARLDVARVISLQARNQLDRSRRMETDKEKLAEKVKARELFLEAAQRLKEAAAAIDNQIKSLGAANTPQEKALLADLNRAKLQASVEAGANLLQEASTHSNNKIAAQKLDAAVKELKALSESSEKHPLIYSARAWYYRALVEQQSKTDADKVFSEIMNERSPLSEMAKRQARAFRLIQLRNEAQDVKGFANYESAALRWIADYRAYLRTPEGTRVLYDLAALTEGQAQPGLVFDKDTKRLKSVTPAARTALLKADNLYRQLTKFDNEFSARAHERRVRIAWLTYNPADTDLSKKSTLEDLQMAVRVDLWRAEEAMQDAKDQLEKLKKEAEDAPDNKKEEVEAKLKKEAPALEKKIKEGRAAALKRVIPALDAGLTKFDKAPTADKLEAGLLLARLYNMADNPEKAASTAEQLAKRNSRTTKGLEAAELALGLYKLAASKAKEVGDEDREKKNLAQVRAFAEFAAKTWPTEPFGDRARHTLAGMLYKEDKPLEAINVYHTITPTYALICQARREQGALAYNLVREEEIGEPEKQALTVTLQDLALLPIDAAQGDIENAKAYCGSKVQLGYIMASLYLKQFTRAERIAEELLQQIPKITVLAEDKETTEEMRLNVVGLDLYAKYMRAFRLVKEGKHKEAVPIFDVALGQKPPEKDSKAAENVRLQRRNLLMVALRSAVSDGDIPRAQAMLEKLNAEGGSDPEQVNRNLTLVIATVQRQIKDLKAAGGTKKELETTVARFTSFLDELKKRDDLPDNLKAFLANGYMSLEKYDRAAELLEKVTRPNVKEPIPPTEPKKPDENAPQSQKVAYEKALEKFEQDKEKYNQEKVTADKALGGYRIVQFTLAKAYRLDRKFYRAQKILDAISKTWGRSSMDVRKEQGYLLEDWGKFKEAMDHWKALQRSYQKFPSEKVDERKQQLRTMFYECFFHQQRCAYRWNMTIKDPAKKKEFLTKQAKALVERFEKNPQTADWGGDRVRELFHDWLEGEPEFRKLYEAAGGQMFKQKSKPTDTKVSK